MHVPENEYHDMHPFIRYLYSAQNWFSWDCFKKKHLKKLRSISPQLVRVLIVQGVCRDDMFVKCGDSKWEEIECRWVTSDHGVARQAAVGEVGYLTCWLINEYGFWIDKYLLCPLSNRETYISTARNVNWTASSAECGMARLFRFHTDLFNYIQ